jgi:hypothetical protein
MQAQGLSKTADRGKEKYSPSIVRIIMVAFSIIYRFIGKKFKDAVEAAHENAQRHRQLSVTVGR